MSVTTQPSTACGWQIDSITNGTSSLASFLVTLNWNYVGNISPSDDGRAFPFTLSAVAGSVTKVYTGTITPVLV